MLLLIMHKISHHRIITRSLISYNYGNRFFFVMREYRMRACMYMIAIVFDNIHTYIYTNCIIEVNIIYLLADEFIDILTAIYSKLVRYKIKM